MALSSSGIIDCFGTDYCYIPRRHNPYPNYNIGEYPGHVHLYVDRVCITCGDGRLTSPPRYVPVDPS